MNEKERKAHNKRVLAKWIKGENLSTSTLQDSFFPDRSKGFVKKDADAIKLLYGEDPIDEVKQLKLVKNEEDEV